ncbi:D-alanine--D-alanine ligase family protein [Natranaerobius trueperi]|uniref:D-alanine--D-alanine ligase n=1 Tax=Natranaerobius trueperi TaxID=759412 RepID=A0A226BXW0_9FIRM|nr:D-alanine--D-alanine ligase family protein [Natranaerobius trueperi]OWZ83622.1 D-alanine--D-alanine ligase A [Natranaerobius trueperi]
MHKIKIGVIFGGKSGEHEVSLKSAKSVIYALDKNKFEIIPIGIKKDGTWISGEKPLEELEKGKSFEENFSVTMMPDPTKKGLWKLDPFEKFADIDVVFPVLHGTYGEDGTLQGFLELCDIPYVGSGVLGSSLAMDKVMMKQVLKNYGLKVANYQSFFRFEWESNHIKLIQQIESSIKYPMFVKPANLGSSVGISKANKRSELIEAINLATRYDMKCLVEEYIPGKEIEISILGNQYPKASITGEIIPANEFYDYESKYLNDRSELLIPASISENLASSLQKAGIAAYQALECRGLCRVDFFVLEETQEVYINELNTMPGFTEISMYPKLWKNSGIPYSKLLSELVELAINHQKEKDKNLTEFQ